MPTNYLWPHRPSPKQRQFLGAVGVREALYGGAAGGGKSDALLMAASRHVNNPGWHALLVRRTYADLALPGALMDRALSWWNGKRGVKFNRQQKRFDWQGGGSVSFGYLDRTDDHLRYQGSELTFVGIDEAGQLRPEQMIYLASRLRKPKDVDLPLQMRYASNPGGIAHDWLKERFVDAEDPDCLFVPALVDDNPGLDAESYKRQLALLDPVTRAQLEHGDWNVAIKSGWIEVDRIREGRVADQKALRVRAWDLASGAEDGDYTASVLMSRDNHVGVYVIEDIRRGRWRPHENERQMTDAAGSEPGRTITIVEREPGSAGENYISHLARNVLPGIDLRPWPPSGSKTDRAAPLAAAVANGLVELVPGPMEREFRAELAAFPFGPHDDMVDAAAMAYSLLSSMKPGRRGWIVAG